MIQKKYIFSYHINTIPEKVKINNFHIFTYLLFKNINNHFYCVIKLVYGKKIELTFGSPYLYTYKKLYHRTTANSCKTRCFTFISEFSIFIMLAWYNI